VSIIRSAAEREAAIEFGKAAAVRPAVVGQAMTEICRDSEVAKTMFEILETQRIVESECHLTLLRTSANGLLADLLSAEPAGARSRSSVSPARAHEAPAAPVRRPPER
jgi:hypothetical protein